ncbi:GNAT family N-acetyltransferase [Rhodovulum euryhalinum]|uniref:Ribosomal-protein-alanine N-acetyltransferase n=1 Tax=Rhodovulum euryhalinum TaxID=35805 RepID=A0A4R2KSA3_9RHOB|nr:GNAT family N-acetyltransferase [Rhodovulum euryhalinum]TCO73886.1 ribosomal-protein-alanine N-acetyltransferase [Rhodovulum euryhalinum]
MTPDALSALHALCFGHPRPWSGPEFVALLESPGVFLVGDGSAFALGRVVLDEAELLTLAVHPGARRRGLGRARLGAFETAALDRGAARTFLEVAADNGPARALYASAGYALTGRRRGYYAAPDGRRIDALLMSRALAG